MKQYILALSTLLVLLSCMSANNNSTQTEAESFDSFNVRFYSDSLFQLSRIQFPIEGKRVDGFQEQEWTSQNWELLKAPVSDHVDTTEFKHNLVKSGTLVKESYWIEDSGFKIERHFRRKNGKWYLTYYNDINL